MFLSLGDDFSFGATSGFDATTPFRKSSKFNDVHLKPNLCKWFESLTDERVNYLQSVMHMIVIV